MSKQHMTTHSTPDAKPLLVELFTEELPPKALQKLGQAFSKGLQDALQAKGLLKPDCQITSFATPRRLATRLSHVIGQAPEQSFTEKLMPVKVGLDANGAATPALLKKLAAKDWGHIDPSTLSRESDGKQDYLVMHGQAVGANLHEVLQGAIETALAGLPIPKVMKYQLADGVTSVKFVRPAHALITLWGDEVIPATVLGLTAGRSTFGHRFLHPQAIEISTADTYETQLAHPGHVIASFEARRDDIASQLNVQANQLGATIGNDLAVAELLDEVTALVEAPKVYVGKFEKRFLKVPQECLILTMRLNQKYFPLFDKKTSALSNEFLIVSNMPTDKPSAIIEGNERVVRPRLADAEFFFETDRKVPLHDRVAQLDSIVYHNKLGSQRQRIERVRIIAAWLAAALSADLVTADRAALLAKADLTTNMVGEFPELQGIMGAYYARGDAEDPSVVEALLTQYRIRIEAPVLKSQLTATILFMAERAETLVGIWGIGLAPTGERDPFGLRRAALGLISAFEQLTTGGFLRVNESGCITLSGLLSVAASSFNAGTLSPDTESEVSDFIVERLRNALITQHDRNAVEAVLALNPPLHQILARVQAAETFAAGDHAAALSAANKRIGNLLKKSLATLPELQQTLLSDAAEIKLAHVLNTVEPITSQHVAKGEFVAAMQALAQTREAVDAFFTDVMVMADDEAVRNNRLALLSRLHALMNQVADISRLAA